MNISFVRAKVNNSYLVLNKIYKVEGYDAPSKMVLIRNENPTDPFVLVDLPLDWFEVYEPKVLYVNFSSKQRVA